MSGHAYAVLVYSVVHAAATVVCEQCTGEILSPLYTSAQRSLVCLLMY
jgi:hypothetical protein